MSLFNKNDETNKHLLIIGLFCLHVICMLEHLRVQRVPNEYILKRYTKKAKTRETFDRRDYKTVSFDGTSFLYQQNEVLQLSMKVARTSTKSEEQRAFAKQSLLELIEKLEAMGCSTPDDDEGGNTCPDIKKLEPDMTQFSNGNPVKGQDKQSTEPETAVRVYKAPPKSKTKGSGKQAKKTADYKTVGPGKKKKKEKQELIAVFDEDAILDEEEEGVRKCGICGEYKKHNARTCPKRPELAGVDDTAALEGRVGKKKRKRICQGCNMLSDHNVLTCPVLKNALTIARTMEASKKLKNNKKTKRRKEEDSGEDSDEDTEEDEERYEEAEDNDEDEDGDDKEDDEQDEEPTPPEPKKRRSSRLK